MIDTVLVACVPAMALLALGWIVLARACPHSDRSACQTSLLLCTLGMAAGLVLDTLHGQLAMLDALCLNGKRDPVRLMAVHWQQLPAMHSGMLLGSLLTLAFPVPRSRTCLTLRCWAYSWARSALCSAFMLAGMDLGALAHDAAGTGIPSVATMLTLMTVGMTLGTVMGVAAVSPLRPGPSRRPMQPGSAPRATSVNGCTDGAEQFDLAFLKVATAPELVQLGTDEQGRARYTTRDRGDFCVDLGNRRRPGGQADRCLSDGLR